jgi:putative chitinase
MVPVTDSQILRLAPQSILLYRKAFDNAEPIFSQYGINSCALRVAHFLAQILHESGGFRLSSESLNYSVDGLLATFGKRITREQARALGRTSSQAADQQGIAEAVYGGAWGKKNLGNLVYGDGWRFRGRGPIQLTGRANYQKFGEALGLDLVASPELAIDPRYVLQIPALYWSQRGCNELADHDDLRAVTKAINGGAIGLAERAAWLKKTKAVFLAS